MPVRLHIRLAAAVAVALALTASAAAATGGDYDDGVRVCLRKWGEHPFNAAAPRYRVASTSVKVLGIGTSFRDDQPSATPELVYVRSSTSLWSRLTLDLLNPNGWYCLQTSVSVMAKMQINLHCKAKLASTTEGTNVMGGGDAGVNVMGATAITRVGCD